MSVGLHVIAGSGTHVLKAGCENVAVLYTNPTEYPIAEIRGPCHRRLDELRQSGVRRVGAYPYTEEAVHVCLSFCYFRNRKIQNANKTKYV